MNLSDFDYNLPSDLIANTHIQPRDHSRLFLYSRENGKVEHKHFYDIFDYLDANDVLVFNDTKVFKARIFGKKETGGKIEFLLIRPDTKIWETLIRGKVGIGDKVFFEEGIEAEILEKNEKICRVKFNKKTEDVFQYLEKKGEMPLPPYIHPVKSPPKRGAKQFDRVNFYQTVYAENVGSVAAPTAGFHFTPELIEKIKAKGIKILHVTLHVGPGTFLPVETENITEHKMHEEFYEVKKEVWYEILEAKQNGKRIVAVGTTTSRTLEALASKYPMTNDQCPRNSDKIFGSTDIFIYPPYEFKIVDKLITNFHLPKSTLLMLVSAFASPGDIKGVEIIKKLYNEAVEGKYRFYSFGDSMFIC